MIAELMVGPDSGNDRININSKNNYEVNDCNNETISYKLLKRQSVHSMRWLYN